MSRIYLDNAATSWPKPETVYEAVEKYQRQIGAPAGRGVYREAVEAAGIVAQCRRAIAQLINAADPSCVAFTLNGTDALNQAIHGLLDGATDRPHVVTTVVEHNSVLRPLRTLELAGRIDVTRVGCDATGIVSPDALRRAMRNNTRLVALNHASNVTGAIQSASTAAMIAHEQGALLLLDAAQTLGEIPIDVRQWGVDLLAAPGHKGLLGPLGTGLLYVAPSVAALLQSTRQGGTGTQSELDQQPWEMPEKFESGNLNLPGIAGLGAGVRWLLSRGLAELHAQQMSLTQQLLAGLTQLAGVRIVGPTTIVERVGLVSITVDGYDPQELAATLDSAAGIQARAGLHCAPLVHQTLGTLAQGGTLRFSLGPFNTAADIATTLEALAAIVAS
jgi:cysteine desulfurase/selenocysteine lyase